MAFKSNYKKDDEYRLELAKGLEAEYGIRATADSLNSIMGAEELADVLKNELKPEHFSLGENYKNVINGTYRVNLHMHTCRSDGTMRPKELLDQVEKYSQYRKSLGQKNPVIVSITDHDMVSSAKEAVKIIAENPESYKNIKLVPGVEFNAYYQTEKEKIPFEVLGYGINPFKTELPPDKDVAAFLEEGTVINNDYLHQLVHEGPDIIGQPCVPDSQTGGLQQWEDEAGIPKGEKTSVEEFKQHSVYMRDLGSPAFMGDVQRAFVRIFKERGWTHNPNDPNDRINKVINSHNANYGNIDINPGTASIEKIADVVKGSGHGFLSISHPARSFKKMNVPELLSHLKKAGVEGAEVNYLYLPQDKLTEEPIKTVKDAVEKLNMMKTGGLDSHSDNIFVGRGKGKHIHTLPPAVQAIIKG